MPSLEEVCILIPGTYKDVSLHGKRDFAGVPKLRIVRWRNYPGLSRWAQCNHKGLYKGKREARETESEMEM